MLYQVKMEADESDSIVYIGQMDLLLRVIGTSKFYRTQLNAFETQHNLY